MIHFKKSTYLIHAIGSAAVLTANVLFLHQPILGTFALIWHLVFMSFVSGRIAVREGAQYAIGLLAVFSVIAVIGTGFIWLKSYTLYASLLLPWLLPAIGFYWYDHARQLKPTLRSLLKNYLDTQRAANREPLLTTAAGIGYGALIASAVLFLFVGQTQLSIQSPWQTVSSAFFFFYGTASVLLMYFILTSYKTTLALVLTSVHFFVSSGVALIVYTLGYGYDPFIHRATELIITTTGGINPTPLYYLGQYSIVIFLQQLSGLPLDIVDRLLVPLLFALIVPTILYQALNQWFDKRYSVALALCTLILPFSGFIMTVPQNLANVWFIATIACCVLYLTNRLSAWVLYGIALATTTIHPLAGIPLITIVFLVNIFYCFQKTSTRRPLIYLGIAAISSLALPLALLASLAVPSMPTRALIKNLIWHPQWFNKADLMLDLTYLWGRNGGLLIAALGMVGIWYIRRHKLWRQTLPFIAAAGMLIGSYLITYFFLSFPALSNHDQPDFIKRLLTLAIYSAGPILFIGLHYLLKTLWEYDRSTKVAVLVTGGALLTMSLYLSYPRLNQYEPAKFFSVSHSDLAAVNVIEQTARPDHIVLANQMIGAVAIQEIGFKHYYHKEFFYSLPSGDPHKLHDYFLEMIYQGATRETMEEAMDYAGVSEGYFVLNKYWNNSARIANQARQSADEVITVDNGEVYIFKYQRR